MTTTVSRRGFLGALAAFTAAVASGAKMIPASSGLPALPCQTDLLASLEECRCVSTTYSLYAYGQHPNTFEATFVHSPDAPLSSQDEFARARMKDMLPIKVTEELDDNGRKKVTVVLA